ncbi:MAG: hypothetical protein FJ218_00935, partial [Ignavibacteria bacterium]|nr:hypothetical protein [Ignavibacteria bacterium]
MLVRLFASFISVFLFLTPTKLFSQGLTRDSILHFNSSPYFLGEDYSRTLATSLIYLNSVAKPLGFDCIILPTPPTSDDYFWVLIRSLAIGVQSEVDTTQELVDELKNRWDEIQPVIGTVGNDLDLLLKKLQSERMKAVRNRDGKKAKFYLGLFNRFKSLERYGKLFHTIITSVRNNEDLMEALLLAGGSLRIYSGSQDALQNLLDESDDESIKSALR